MTKEEVTRMKQALRRRGISLLLSVCMMLSLLPLSAIPVAAADGYISTPWVEQIAAQLAEEGYGKTPRVYPIDGSDLAYLLYTRMEDDEDGNPVMEGAGIFVRQTEEGGNYKIPDYDGTSEQPWGKANLKQIYIADGITGVGDYAFSSIVTLKKLEFENSSALTEVGRYAFANNRGLKSDGFDLSGVTALGEYAFTGCGGLAGVTLGDRLSAIEMRDGREVVTPNRVPNHVFSGAGLKSVNIPKAVTEIGDYAFASCPLDEMETIELPEGLTEIGNYAFYRAVTSANQSVKELTIPASVTSIGAYAFYNYQGLSVVTVEEGSLLDAVGDAAFGTGVNSAYHTVGDIVDSSGTLKFEDVPIGADFRLPQEIAEKNLFRNGETCYTGFVSPLVYLRTDEPTCTESGRHYYSLTYGETTIEVTRSIPPLGHAWSEPDYVGNSCERDGYWFKKCSRCELVEEVEGETDPATGHLWKIDEVKYPVIADGTATVFIYKCENKWHDNDRDENDSPVSFEVTGKTLTADTTETLADLTQELRALSSDGLFTWNLPEEQLSQPLNFGTHKIPVSFKLNYMGITSDPVTADPMTGAELKVTVDVAKTPLDLSGVIFENMSRCTE